MNYFRGKSVFEKLITTAKSFCIILAAFTLVVFSGCDFLFPKEEEKEDVVTISQSSAEIRVGATITLVATSSEGRAIRWISSDDGVAEVDGGEVTGVGEGTATVTASDGKKMATCEITVLPEEKQPDEGDPDDPDNPDNPGEEKPEPPAVTVTLSQTKAEITEGASFTLVATVSDGSAVRWSSLNGGVAVVDSNGKVTGVKAGTAVIKASVGSVVATCEVTVKEAVTEQPTEPGRKLVWSDEFDGNSLDMTKWGYQTGIQDNYYGNYGPEYWGNGELQYYTDGANVKVSDGSLQITAKRENMPNGRTYSSARITTRDLFTTTYGLIEARMKTPATDGMWPAFWMLPQPPNHSSTNNEYGGWPANGELDIMEAKGRLKNVIDTTLHFGGPDWNIHDMAGKSTTMSSSTEEWHTYAVDWRADHISWLIDGEEVYRVESSRWWTSAVQNSVNSSAPFDKPYYILLNLAVGGMYDSYVNPPDSFTQATMYVDYVRVYE